MTTTELWQVIPKFEYRYMASSMGRVFDLKKWKVINTRIMNRGYIQACIYNGEKQTTQFVHRLVLMAFAGLPPKQNSVGMHMDDNPENNNLSNLQRGDMSENIKQAYKKGRKKPLFIPARGKFGKYNKAAKAVEQLDIKTGNVIKRFDSMIEVQRELKIHASHISSCCTGRIKTAYGYKWRVAS